jgi:hypothetical protein
LKHRVLYFSKNAGLIHSNSNSLVQGSGQDAPKKCGRYRILLFGIRASPHWIHREKIQNRRHPNPKNLEGITLVADFKDAKHPYGVEDHAGEKKEVARLHRGSFSHCGAFLHREGGTRPGFESPSPPGRNAKDGSRSPAVKRGFPVVFCGPLRVRHAFAL